MLCNNPEEPRLNILIYLSLIVSVLVTSVPAHICNLRTQARKLLGFVFLPLLRRNYSERSHCYKMLRSVCKGKRNCSRHLSAQEPLEPLLKFIFEVNCRLVHFPLMSIEMWQLYLKPVEQSFDHDMWFNLDPMCPLRVFISLQLWTYI